MIVFVTGAGGQLGRDLTGELLSRGHTPIGSDLAPQSDLPVEYIPLDITDGAAVERTLNRVRPDAVIHCAAWTAVDAAELPENADKVQAVNVGGTENLVLACKKVGCKLIYISTDYVFSGTGSEPWQPDQSDFAPQNVYGQSKLDGEKAILRIMERYFIVRIAWLFGKGGKNFVRTMLEVGKRLPSVRVVCDQVGTPTYSKDLARLLVDMAESEKYGIYHVTNGGGYVSRSDLTREIYRIAGLDTAIIPVTSDQFDERGAKRPMNSRMDLSKLTAAGFVPLPDWRDAIARYLAEIGELENHGTN